jgi:ATP-dependent RNA helicase DBP3
MRVVVGGEELNANHMVTQIVECIEGGYAKDKRLLTLLEKYHKSRTNRYGTALRYVVLCCVVFVEQ